MNVAQIQAGFKCSLCWPREFWLGQRGATGGDYQVCLSVFQSALNVIECIMFRVSFLQSWLHRIVLINAVSCKWGPRCPGVGDPVKTGFCTSLNEILPLEDPAKMAVDPVPLRLTRTLKWRCMRCADVCMFCDPPAVIKVKKVLSLQAKVISSNVSFAARKYTFSIMWKLLLLYPAES